MNPQWIKSASLNSRKYRNKKVEVDGILFDSKKEANRYIELKLLKKAGEITDLKRQVRYELIPRQREQSTEMYKAGPHKGEYKPGKVVEQSCYYVADFVYKEGENIVVEDTKGMRTKDYVIKRKLMLHKYGIRIKEV
nr:MAG TPA: Endonuclease [Caudoviricetes sp.]